MRASSKMNMVWFVYSLLSVIAVKQADCSSIIDRLPLADINIIAVTDVHAWLEGGDLESTFNTSTLDANFGDLISFTQRLKAEAKAVGKDVFLVDNGDVVDGTGLSNSASDHCSYLLPVLQKVPFDALNCGNHELYDNATMETFRSTGYIKSWKGRYLTSNLLNTSDLSVIGSRYTVLEGAESGVKILTFGFMYNMNAASGLCGAVTVVSVEETVNSTWFIDALNNEGASANAILLLAHMDAFEPLLTVIVNAIRKYLPKIPIQIIAGHSHKRQATMIDSNAAVFEPGNFFNTVGFASIDLASSSSSSSSDSNVFTHVDIDASTSELAGLVNSSVDTFPTSDGKQFSQLLESTRKSLGLTQVLGCNRQLVSNGPTLQKLYTEHIIPESLFEPPNNMSQWFISGSSALRYSLFPGNVTVDDIFKVLPFQDTMFVIRRQRGYVLSKLLQQLDHGGNDEGAFITTNPKPSNFKVFDVIVPSFDLAKVVATLSSITKTEITPLPFRGNFTDTDTFIQWANSSLGSSCTQ